MKIKEKIYRVLAVYLSVLMLTQVLYPTASWALTSGPSQPEVQSFEPVGTTEMVDLFSGDFTYNIPLFELPGPNGGYPFNLHYNSNISMDQEATWTGLGWNLNPGSITRQMRGLPDELDGSSGDKITHLEDMKDNVTYGAGLGAGVEIAGGDTKEGLGLNLGLTIYYNNYKGVGFSLDQGISITQNTNKHNPSGGVGLDFKMDSQEGVGVNASLSLTDKHDDGKNSYSLGIGFNSKSGAQVSMGMSTSRKERLAPSHTLKNKSKTKSNSIGGSSTLSFNSDGFMPSVSMPMTGKNITLTFKVGGEVTFGNINGYINGFYNAQGMKNGGVTINTPAYGYLFLHKATPDAMLDFNREKDGMVRKTTPNLAIPVLNADIYSVTGHGIAGMYRAFRNDVPVVYDPFTESEIAGGALGIEAAGGFLFEVGGDVSVNYSGSESAVWGVGYPAPNVSTYNSILTSNPNYEPYYFKTYGEHTTDSKSEMNYIQGDTAVRIKLNGLDTDVSNTIESDYGVTKGIANSTSQQQNREPRNVTIGYVNNNPKSGMYAVNADGSRYFYKKALNTQHVECLYASGALNDIATHFGTSLSECTPTIPIWKTGSSPKHDFVGTDEYYKRTEMPDYAHSYMLDYILGADYIDADDTIGPSDGDMGYWIKFGYNEDISDTIAGAKIMHKWRVPFYGANYIRGKQTVFEDDKGSYTYGEKEVYYLTSVESKTHIARFYTSRRKDGRGVYGELQNRTDAGNQRRDAYSRKLDRITLCSKLNGSKPIKSVFFEYSYELCKGVDNNDSTADTGYQLSAGVTTSGASITNQGGKLTLKKVWFSFENNARGNLSPYIFTYNHSNSVENPNYSPYAYDRWGNYKPVVTSCLATEAPYVDQFYRGNSEFPYVRSNKDLMDQYMAVWNLKGIKLPSGGYIDIQYEADDYAYVQNKRATQMFQIESVSPTFSTNKDRIDHEKGADKSHRRVYFKLEERLDTAYVSDLSSPKEAIEPYIKGIDKLYFKAYMYIGDDTNDKLKDYVSGYVGIEDYGLAADSGGYYNYGYIEMAKPTIGTKKGAHRDQPYHPFSMAAWQYIRTDVPKLSYAADIKADPDDSESDALAKVKSLTSIVGQIETMFKGFNDYAYNHKENGATISWGDKLVLSRSFIRLNSPDKIKYGGGSRVKQIVLSDHWKDVTASEDSSVYGQVYDYTIEEKNGTVSSGVAVWEPSIGADENPFKTAKDFVEAIPMKTNNNLYFEYPINESYYPGAGVGYRKVTVKSIATHYSKQTDGTSADPYNIPDGIIATGAVVHEFFTAKEFPVITRETKIDINFEDIFIPIPLIGQLSSNKLTASQGYCTILNDMHGKPRKISNFKNDGRGNVVWDAPESYVEYLYQYKTHKLNASPNSDYYELTCEFPTLRSDVGGTVDRHDGTGGKPKRLIGQDYEFFTDMRYSRSVSESGGLKLNTDGFVIPPSPVAFPIPWPSLSRAVTEVKLAVTNKIIHRSGVLIGTRAYDGGSTVLTENVLFDDLTGEPILTRVTNDFNDPIYSYDMPAHFAYDEAGPAYLNIGIETAVTSLGICTTNTSHLVQGDELMLKSNNAKRIIYVNDNNTHNCKQLRVADVATEFTGGTYVVVRSGRRNQLSAKIGNIRTLGDKDSLELGDPTLQSNRY